MRNSKTKSYYLLIILASSLFLVCLTFILYNVLFKHQTFDVVNIILIFLTAGILVSFVILAVINFYSIMKEKRILTKQNVYLFKRAILFNNLSTFLNLVNPRYLTIKDKEEAYIMSFTPFSERTLLELVESDAIIDFYGLFVDYIIDYFKTHKEYKKINVEYCYDQRCFVFYLKTPYSNVEKIMKDFEDEAYKIKKEHDYRLYVQTFFGLYKIENVNKVSLFEAVNNSGIARRYGENNYELAVMFKQSLVRNNDIENGISVESILEGLKNNEFEVYYQPKFHLKSKRFIGSEALIRWKSPKYGFVSPNSFITLAENAGIIHDIDIYLLDKVCHDIEEWKKRGREILPVSVNVSLYEFYEPTFVNDISHVLDKYHVNPIYIEIEITEKTNSAYSFLIVNVLKKIKDMKIKILMDDFGTGFSNIVNLKKLPIDIVKLDKSLIDDIAFDVKAKEIVRAITLSCHAMNISLIAEGADSKEQIKILNDLQVDAIQGYYYSKPLPKIDYERFLSNNEFEKKGK